VPVVQRIMLADEARHCRDLAREFSGKQEEGLLLSIAQAFEQVALKRSLAGRRSHAGRRILAGPIMDI